jgi:hypothetical protein
VEGGSRGHVCWSRGNTCNWSWSWEILQLYHQLELGLVLELNEFSKNPKKKLEKIQRHQKKNDFL